MKSENFACESQPQSGATLVQSNHNHLRLAVEKGSLQSVAIILRQNNVLIKSQSPDGTVLHIAAKYGRVEIVKYLVEKGADQLAVDLHGNTPIHLAAKIQPINSFLYLASEGESIQVLNDLNESALELFYDHQTAEVFQCYLDGVDLSRNKACRWALMLLASKKQVPELLIKKALSFDNLLALLSNDLPKFNHLFTFIVQNNRTRLILQIIAFFKSLPEENCSSSVYSVLIENQNALQWAVTHGNVEGVKFLLSFPRLLKEKQSRSRTTGHAALKCALQKRSFQITELLVNSGVETGTLLNYCIDKRLPRAFVELLVKHSASLGTKTGIYRLTPLHRAVLRNNGVAVRAILQHLVNTNDRLSAVNVVAKDGFTPLHDAVWSRDDDLVRTLVEAGSCLDEQLDGYLDGFTGATPLNLAVRSRHIKLTVYLINNGASVDLFDDSGRKPLDWAIKAREIDLVNLLIAAGTDICSLRQEPLFYFDPWFTSPEGQDIRDRLIRNGYEFDFPSEADLSPNDLENERRMLVLKAKPLPLQDQCVLAIRRCLKPRLWVKVTQLPIPLLLAQYITADVNVEEICDSGWIYKKYICSRLHLYSGRAHYSHDPIVEN